VDVSEEHVARSFDGLHGVISQKKELFITTAVRASNPTCNNKRLVDRFFMICDT
jgi:hypothetical protein